jgi:small-conductance mechanosensitive channel
MLVALPLPLQALDAGQQTLISTWDQSARRAEEALQAGQASSDAMEILRVELAQQRAEAENLAGSGQVLIRALKAQIEALGPAPAKDQTEPAAVAARRAELGKALARAEELPLAARQAFARANVLIEEIDALVRRRSTTDLLTLGPSPLMPSAWSAAGAEVMRYYDRVADDTRRYRSTEFGSEGTFEDRLPPALGLGLAGILLPLVLGHFLLVRLERRMAGRPGSWSFVLRAAGIHVVRLVLSLAGATMLLLAFIIIEIGPHTGQGLMAAVFVGLMIFVLANWIGNILFAPNQPLIRLVHLGDGSARACYWLALAFAAALSIEALVDGAAEDFAFSPQALAVLRGISIAISGVVLAGLARVLLVVADEQRQAQPAPDDDNPLGPGFFVAVARGMQVLALVCVVACVVGYVPLARAALAPLMLSFALFGLAYIVHHAIMVPVNGGFRRHQSTAALISMALAVLLVLTCIPLLALVWGARAAEISEVWRLLQNGIDIGGARLSPKVLLVLVLTFLVGLFLTRWLQRVVDRVVLPKTRIDRGARNAVNTGLGYVGVILSALFAISAAGLDLSNLAIIAGALSVGVGFGMQAIVSNFVSGIILLIERPIKEGDWIEVSGFSGVVRKIAVRSTRIETFDRHDVIIPNADLISGTVKNRTLSSRIGRLVIPVSVKADIAADRLRQMLLVVVRANAAILPAPEPQIFLTRIGGGNQDFELRCFLRDVGTETATRSDLLFAMSQAFEREGLQVALG